MDPGGPSPSHYGARRPSSVEPGGPPLWNQEALLYRARRSHVEPGGPLWNQDSLLCRARRPSVEPGGPPL